MTDYDMTRYDADDLTINQYISLLAELNVRLTNIKSNKILLEKRKKKAFEVLSEKIKALEGEELEKWKDKVENVFNPKKVKKEQNQVDFSDYKVGEIVFYYTNYKYKSGERMDVKRIKVKCMIKKINKCSITLAKYNCDIDFSEFEVAFSTQGFGRIKFKWTDELRHNDIAVVKNVSKLIRRGDDMFEIYSEQSESELVDFGR